MPNEDFDTLVPATSPLATLNRRQFVGRGVGTGFAAAVLPVSAQTIKTSVEGLVTFEDLPDGAAQVKIWQSDQLVDVAAQTSTIGAAQANNIFQLTVVPRKRRS